MFYEKMYQNHKKKKLENVIYDTIKNDQNVKQIKKVVISQIEFENKLGIEALFENVLLLVVTIDIQAILKNVLKILGILQVLVLVVKVVDDELKQEQ